MTDVLELETVGQAAPAGTSAANPALPGPIIGLSVVSGIMAAVDPVMTIEA